MTSRLPSKFVYFVQSGDEFGPVKVGVTNNISKRLEMLRTRTPDPLTCLATFDFGDEEGARWAEAMFHSLFAEERRPRSEWFDWTDDFVDLISGMRQIEQTFGPNGARISVRFNLVRLAAGGIRFRPATRETDEAVHAAHPDLKERGQ